MNSTQPATYVGMDASVIASEGVRRDAERRVERRRELPNSVI